ncbi:MAG: aminopeptidase [Chlorobi bacterium]|nr:aminopeptidase [Chlorobiota bacterium]
MKKRLQISLFAFFGFLFSIVVLTGFSQDNDTLSEKGYHFTMEKQIPATSVKNQYRSGTCWSFSTLSFIESELLRMGKGDYDLSEMFCVWHVYSDKADKYVRAHGSLNFGGGGALNDPLDVIKNYGMVPEEVYTGMNIGEKNHIHGEMDAVLKGMIDEVLKNKNRKLTPQWHNAFDGMLDAYLGKIPENFTYKGKSYTPRSFADELGFNPDDYLYFTSYTHHPFYEKFILEVPDNWSWNSFYNVPLNDLMAIIDNAIDNGYSIAWAADVSEKGFSWKNGIAIVPDEDVEEVAGMEKDKWANLSKKEKQNILYNFEEPVKEKVITQELRQKGYDNYTTTDDHGMHIVGKAKDQNGTEYYYIKNSWGTKNTKYDGYFYASKAFVEYKTMSILIHKDALPKSIAKKLK